jgi:PAS domain S-box-containing protein
MRQRSRHLSDSDEPDASERERRRGIEPERGASARPGGHLRERAVDVPIQREHDPKALAHLQASVERLKVAEDELRQQNHELQRAREALEYERQRYLELFEFAPDGYVVTDPSGIVEEANRAATELVNVAPRFLRRRPLARFIAGEDLPAFWRELERLKSSDEVRELTLCLRPRRRAPHYAAVTVSPVRDHAGTLISLRWAIRDITDRVRAQEHIRTLNNELEERVRERTLQLEKANRAKSDFLATMSHEIRTPLNAIIGYAELLDVGVVGPLNDAQRGFIQRIQTSGAHLVGLVSEILDMSRIESGTLAVERERGRASDSVSAALALIRPQAAASRVRLSNRCGRDSDGIFLGDEGRIRQILLNLLSNAIKFTDEGGRVRITCGTTSEIEPRAEAASQGPWIFLRVEDDGIGIPEQKLSAIFEPFVQGETGHTRARGGAGLGLSISRRLARLMGGDLTVKSAVGKGSTFTLWMPAASPSAEENGRTTALDGTTAASPEAQRKDSRLLEDLDEIVAALVGRLRTDPATAAARGASDGDLENHYKTYLTDVAQALGMLEEASSNALARAESLDRIRDGTEIQRLIAERHGAQRFRLGFSEGQLLREYDMLREEVEASVQRHAAANGAGDQVEEALSLIRSLINQATRTSLRSFRLAHDDDSD